ncbi:response regulator transcription factor [Mariniphaga sediminis]|uniref:response regulator transcription factor n=1 Tax=Mariniphaga sediminis TaxID=1628158 RepID=UPI00356211FB
MKELYWNNNNSMMIVEDLVSGMIKRIDEMPASFIQSFDAAIATQRPETYKALCFEYGLGPQFAFKRVFQFSACNFSQKDGNVDIDEDFNFITEIVACPIRHRCNLPYCRFESELSKREIEVVRLFAQGFSEALIADQLFISPATVHNHITNIYRKLNLVGSKHPDRLLVTYVLNNKL